ncbi:TDT family transporter [Corynebacterium glucuronolyticum]|uniref:TDT family transporter n=2 Tax=Corynebacteriaceae TaxID=1653 RepID=UPI0008A60949|nr:TDT family transporter [Corynebacterium glucuronolyticum]MCT1441747.1 TDT family transporter [Corynebacterium glucuronolyticum]MCT1563864.1 TDT family transporter [Corynebacterium glucuronolyticum]OFO46479.1 hypothetical protein HMPREF3044_01535 [Corynebacterium sp. HMSC073D01]QQU87500.1 TDT family transporter [Corynebacterium glucuronolyticum]
MGTSIAASLTSAHGLPGWVSAFFATIAAGILVTITVGWLIHRNPHFSHTLMPAWGMYAMGILACGSAWTAVTGNDWFQIISWWIGTPLGIIVCLNQLRGFAGAPTFQWGLALVAPMVGATSGGQLAPDHGGLYHTAGIACFVLSLVTALPIFARVYIDVVRGKLRLPGQIAGTAWIPLGVVGQSTAAAQGLFGGKFAIIYGAVMLIAGIRMVEFAMKKFYVAVFEWDGYSPGWWGSTFPTGTLCLGTHLLSKTASAEWLDYVSIFFLILLLCHWTICCARWATWLLRESPAAHRYHAKRHPTLVIEDPRFHYGETEPASTDDGGDFVVESHADATDPDHERLSKEGLAAHPAVSGARGV